MKLLLVSVFLISSASLFAGKIENLEIQYRVKCTNEKVGFGYGSSSDYPVSVFGNVNNYRCDSEKIGCGHFNVKVKRKYLRKKDANGNVVSIKVRKEKLIWKKGQRAKAREVSECFFNDLLKSSEIE